jgi:hypothetical protein
MVTPSPFGKGEKMTNIKCDICKQKNAKYILKSTGKKYCKECLAAYIKNMAEIQLQFDYERR